MGIMRGAPNDENLSGSTCMLPKILSSGILLHAFQLIETLFQILPVRLSTDILTVAKQGHCVPRPSNHHFVPTMELEASVKKTGLSEPA